MADDTPTIDPHLALRLRLLGAANNICPVLGFTVLVNAGGLVYPWSILIREARIGAVELGEAVGFAGACVTLFVSAWLSAIVAAGLRAISSIRTCLSIGAISGIIGSIPAMHSSLAHLLGGALSRRDLYTLCGGLALLVAAAADGLALIVWRRKILEFEHVRASYQQRFPGRRPRRSVALRLLPVLGLLGVVSWWGLGPWNPVEANERAAERVVHAFNFAQLEFKLAIVVDQDRDGFGEYGYLDELAGLAPPRGGNTPARAWLEFPSDFEPTAVRGVWKRRGYLFTVFLPSATGRATAAPSTPARSVPAEGRFHLEACALYAWPEECDVTGRKAYMAVDRHTKWVTGMDRTRYSGLERRPAAEAALSDAEGSMSVPGHLSYDIPVLPNLNGVPADSSAGLSAADGNTWRRLPR